MIIGLSGIKGSGKDTVGAYLLKEHGFERKAFADPLKKSIAALFDIPFKDVDTLKIDNEAKVEVTTSLGLGLHSGLSFREFLQRYGTEAHREIFGFDFWLDQTLPMGGYYPGRAIVVTDVRFRNEAERVRALGGINWLVLRETVRPEETTPQHSSEVCDYLDLIDHGIDNNGTIDELGEKIETHLAWTATTNDVR
jgi:hypothetical protein